MSLGFTQMDILHTLSCFILYQVHYNHVGQAFFLRKRTLTERLDMYELTQVGSEYNCFISRIGW